MSREVDVACTAEDCSGRLRGEGNNSHSVNGGPSTKRMTCPVCGLEHRVVEQPDATWLAGAIDPMSEAMEREDA
jgi:hypothetical protein